MIAKVEFKHKKQNINHICLHVFILVRFVDFLNWFRLF